MVTHSSVAPQPAGAANRPPRRVLSEAIADTRAVEYAGTSEGQAATEGYSDQEGTRVVERQKDLEHIS